jgi:nucleotide-binding universal stress UspA family protein
MKCAVLISTRSDFPKQQMVASCQLAQAMDLPLTGIITSDQGLDYYPVDTGGFIDVTEDSIARAEDKIGSYGAEFKAICEQHRVAQDWFGKHGFIANEWPYLAPYFDIAITTGPLAAADIAKSGVTATMQIADTSVITSFDKRCVIAWDGSPAAARAMRAALPLLPRFKTVDVIVVDAKSRTLPADIGSYLAAHNISSNIISEVSGDAPVSVVIMDHARQADLVVMGAYGTASVLEKIFGGVTEVMRTECPTPILFAH